MNQAEDHAQFYKKFISLTEWLDAMGHAKTEAIRIEDNDKRERLRVLNRLIGLPFDKPYQFTARQLADKPPEFRRFLEEHGSELCAIRLIPLENSLPKLRMRGKPIREAVAWFEEQDIDPDKYRADFVPHPTDNLWGTIFVVNQHGVFGEIHAGPHHELTQGFSEGEPPISFAFDFTALKLARRDAAAEAHLREIFSLLRVPTAKIQAELKRDLDADFEHDYLTGYFETTASTALGLVFIDYNRILGRLYADYTDQPTPTKTGALLTGQVGGAGKARGRVRIVHKPDPAVLKPGEVLVCRMTTPDYLPLMQKAAAIVTDVGGILSHAAIVARELGKPCLTATGSGTTTLHDGQEVEVDGDAGLVRAV
jgi:phosphohistidine swiveling domain-containing protein